MRNPRILAHSSLLAAFFCLVGFLACSTSRNNGSALTLVNAQGAHPAGFKSTHIGLALTALDQCKTCHGADLTGGIAKMSCFTAACHHDPLPGWAQPGNHGLRAKQAPDGQGAGFAACQICHGADFAKGLVTKDGTTTACTTCHGVAAPHPRKPWHTTASNHATTDPANAVVCAKCHFPGAAANPAGHPATPAPSGTAPGCYNNTLCHGNATAPHALPFLDAAHTAVTQATFSGSCANCHGLSGTSPVATAPLCSACHQAGSPFVQTSCTSCHAKPPAGTTYPDIAGVHAKHNALATVTGACGSCHQGSDSGSLTHYAAADGRAGHNGQRVPPGSVAFLSAFNATSGAAAFNATDQTCSNVSCHGGQTTPSWTAGGTLNPATDCTKCHQVGTAPGLPQTNSASSGFHALHMNSTAGLQCTECHAMSNGTAGALAHFTTLNTAAMEGPASDTVAFSGGTYAPASKTCTVTCHGEPHAAYTWSGNGNVHPAGWSTSHPSGALAGVNACRTCHGANLQGGPYREPSCNTAACHHNTLPGYVLAPNHGARAKKAQGPNGGGLASCQLCHGTNFASGLLASDGTTKACTTCHGVAAPHPPKPWHNPAGSNHATTDGSNAPVCVACHYPGSPSNPVGHPANPAPSGTAPGCFNNTLCHGPEAAPHALGTVWTAATSSAFHGFQAKADLVYCQTCHGTPGTPSFAGGPGASTSCVTCHTQGKAHANTWHDAPVATFPGYVASHRNAGNRTVACAICHDGTQGRTAPDPAAPSCFSATANGVACHANGPGQPNHAVPFLDVTHTSVNQAGFDGNCGLCHAVTGTSPSPSAPLCTSCHQAGSPLTVNACASCHANPPGGTAFPDVAGKHAKHNALTNVTGLCSACHRNATSGTLTHYTHADGRTGHDSLRVAPGEVATDPAYNGKAGAASFNATAYTCSNVSCHGGQTTPSWLTGALASTTEAGCRACHALGTAQGVPENNSPYSGLHALHLNSTQNLQCVECHAMANGTPGALNHFKALNTAAMEGPAGDTVAFSTTTPATSYVPATQSCGSGAFSCHGHAHGANYTWVGGGSHTVPYTGSAHTGVASQAAFDASCKNCHSVSGSSPNASAPLCITCHQAGSPLTQANCTSCHAKPPAGTAFPDVAGKHALHETLAGITGQCVTCHNGAEPGNANNTHYNHANARPGMNSLRVEPGEVAFLTTYNANGATATFDPTSLTCASVSCHGGLPTPNWRTGSIAVNTNAGCLACHTTGTAQGVPQDNSPYSGLHAFHLSAPVNAQCTECHSLTNGSVGAQNHFKFLGTAAMEGPASDTVALMGDGATTGTYTVSGQSCTITCHNQAHIGFKWAGGANHVVPYPDTTHTAATTATFNANCKVCHGETGTSPMAAAPSCVTCHTAGSPLTVTSCASCHSKPPTGTSFPNVAGTHAVHNALAGVTNVCGACHTGSDSGSTTHYNHANNRPGLNGQRVAPGEVAMPATYNAKTGAATFNGSTCSNVSCHGGQTTPVWTTGVINVDTQCTSCHTTSGTTQYNSPASGRHSKSDHVSAGCVACHNTTKLATSHFAGLGTSAIDTTAARASLGGTAKLTSYNTTTRACTTTCHGTDKFW